MLTIIIIIIIIITFNMIWWWFDDIGMDTAAAAMARRQFSMDEEDELYQYAIEQSIIDAGSENDEVLPSSFII